jgi:hypothetical protein
MAALMLAFLLSPRISLAQLSTGTVAGTLRDADGQMMKAIAIIVSSDLGFHATADTDAEGAFLLTLPYGSYQLAVQDGPSAVSSSVPIEVRPLQHTDIGLRLSTSGRLEIKAQSSDDAGVWAGSPRQDLYPEAFNVGL